MIDNYINPCIGDIHLRSYASNTSIACTTTSSPVAAAPAVNSRPRPSTTSTSSSAPRSLMLCDAASSGRTSLFWMEVLISREIGAHDDEVKFLRSARRRRL